MGLVFGDNIIPPKAKTAKKKKKRKESEDSNLSNVSFKSNKKLNNFIIACIHSILFRIVGVKTKVITPLMFDKFEMDKMFKVKPFVKNWLKARDGKFYRMRNGVENKHALDFFNFPKTKVKDRRAPAMQYLEKHSNVKSSGGKNRELTIEERMENFRKKHASVTQNNSESESEDSDYSAQYKRSLEHEKKKKLKNVKGRIE